MLKNIFAYRDYNLTYRSVILFYMGLGVSGLVLEEDYLTLLSALALILMAALEIRRDRAWEVGVMQRLTQCESSLVYLDRIYNDKIKDIQDYYVNTDSKRGEIP